jgi:hypothetical protein
MAPNRASSMPIMITAEYLVNSMGMEKFSARPIITPINIPKNAQVIV